MVRIFGSLLPAAAAICLTASAAVTAASSLTFNSAKFSLTTLDGSSRLSDSFTPASPAIKSLSEGVTLAADEIIRMSFTVPTTGSGASVSDESSEDSESPSSVKKSVGLPEQILLQLVQPREGKVAAIVPSVNQESGKVTFSQRIDRLPVASLAAKDPTYTLRLLLGSSGSAKPLSLDLGTVTIPSLSQSDGATPSIAIGSSSEREKKAREMGFYPWEEKRHTFRKEVTEGMPGEKKSLIVMAVIVIVPWLVLIGLLSPILPTLSFSAKPNPSTLILFGSLLFLETVGVRYYLGAFTLFKMLPIFFVGAAIATGAILAGAVKDVGMRNAAASL